VSQLRRYVASFSITPVGFVALGVLVVALGLFAFGPSGAQAPAMIVAVILLIGAVGGVPFGWGARGGGWGARGGGWGVGSGAWRSGSSAQRRREVGPTGPRDVAVTAADREAEEALWRKERERYAQDSLDS
jgi:hypothetical protein